MIKGGKGVKGGKGGIGRGGRGGTGVLGRGGRAGRGGKNVGGPGAALIPPPITTTDTNNAMDTDSDTLKRGAPISPQQASPSKKIK